VQILKTSPGKLLAFAALATFAPLAQASGIICRILPFLCPPAPGTGGGGTSVPEPATLAVLAVGACAAGLAARRRRNKK
jgi:hypothetical protein